MPEAIGIVSPQELLELATKDEIESRLITQDGDDKSTNAQWQLHHGPFEPAQFSALPAEQWTLLVQAVDHYRADIAALLAALNFIPRWRIDDIMISYAAEGGNVGPHFDQYDVFLVQVSGVRHWRIGQHCDADSATREDSELCLLSNFEDHADYLLEPGDVLYVPPGQAHYGIAQDSDCITLSIGFRAPSASEMLSALSDRHNLQPSAFARFRDPERSPEKEPERKSEKDSAAQAHIASAEISSADLDACKRVLRELLEDEAALADAFASLVTESKYLDALDQFDDIDDTDGFNELDERATFNETEKRPEGMQCQYRLAGDARLAWHRAGEKLSAYANGERIASLSLAAYSAAAEAFISLSAKLPHSELEPELLKALGDDFTSELLELGILLSAR